MGLASTANVLATIKNAKYYPFLFIEVFQEGSCQSRVINNVDNDTCSEVMSIEEHISRFLLASVSTGKGL